MPFGRDSQRHHVHEDGAGHGHHVLADTDADGDSEQHAIANSNPHHDAHLYKDVDSQQLDDTDRFCIKLVVVDADCHAERHWVKHCEQDRHEVADRLQYGVEVHLSQPERHGHADSQSVWHSDIVSHGIAV